MVCLFAPVIDSLVSELMATREPGWVTWAAAAEILVCSEPTVHQLIRRSELRVDRPGQRQLPSLLRADVERLAAERAAARERREQQLGERQSIRARVADPPGEWIGTTEAATILGCSAAWARWLASRNRLPVWVRPDGVYRFRRQQIEVIANAWRLRPAGSWLRQRL